MDAQVMTPRDREALTRAIKLANAHQHAHDILREGKSQIDRKLEDEPWQKVGEYCSYACQRRSLQLRPWQWPPCWVTLSDSDPEHAPAVALLKRLLANNLSKYEPDPVAALHATEPPRA
jgi:hypothetical protein